MSSWWWVHAHSIYAHFRPRIGSFSCALHCLLERICPADDGVVGDDPRRNALFCVRYLVLKKNRYSVGIRTTRQRGHARSRIIATCKSSSVMQQIVILYIPTIILHSEIHWYSLYVYFFYIALRRLTWPRLALFFSSSSHSNVMQPCANSSY